MNAKRIMKATFMSAVFYWMLFVCIDSYLPSNPRARSERRSSLVALSSLSASSLSTSSQSGGRGNSKKRYHEIDIDGYKKQSAQRQSEHGFLTWLHRNWDGVPAGELEESIVELMVKAFPLYARRKSKRSAEQANMLLDRYIEEYHAGNKAVRLNSTIFHSVMDSYAKCGQPEGAQTVLEKMINLSHSNPSIPLHELEPNVFSYTILATAWAKSRHPQAADKAEELLNVMEDKNMTIETLTYNVVLNAIAVSHDPVKALRAQRLVHKMEHLATNTQTAPDIYTYQSWMNACSRTRGGLDQTIQIFSALDRLAAQGEKQLQPNSHCFSAIIHAWAYSLQPNRSTEAYQLLKEMRRRYEEEHQTHCRPNVVAFTSAISACTFPTNNLPNNRSLARAQFDVATLIFKELCASDYGPPNFLTYSSYLQVCATTLEGYEQRDPVVMQIFETCCTHGCVGRIVMDRFREAASPTLANKVLGRRTWNELPDYWRRNVAGERYKNRQPPFSKNRRWKIDNK